MNVLVLHLVSALVLAIAVEVACRLGRFRPAICHALWLVVLVKLVVPPVVAWPVNPERMVAAYSASGAPGVMVSGPSRESVARGSLADGVPVVEEESLERPPGEERAAPSVGPRASVVAGGFWLLGGVLVTGRIVWEFRRSRRRVGLGQPLPAWLQSRLEETCQLLGVAVPRAVVIHEPGGVYMQIAGTPALVLSEDSLNHVSPDHWHTILTHEVAHLKRRDHWVGWLLLAAGAVWWWNPCFWWVRNRIHLYSEMACDAWVVNVHPGDRKQYAETMVRIMAMLSRQDAPAPAMGLAAWSAATQERRLWMIMKAKGACNVPWRHAVALSALAMLAAPSWLALGAEKEIEPAAAPVEDVGAEAETKPAATVETVDAAAVAEVAPENPGWTLALTPSEMVQKILDNPVNIEFEDIHIKDVFEFIQDSFELNVVLDQRIVKPDPRDKGEPALVPGEPVVEPTPVVAETPIPDSPLGGKPYTTDGIVTYINLKDTPVKEALVALLKPLRLTHQIRGNAVWVSTPEQLAIDHSIDLPSASFSEGDILDKLKSPVNIEFEAIHLQDIVEYMQDSFEINIVVDGQVVMPEGKDWNAPPLGSPGYATDGWVGFINLKDVPMGEALYHITRILNLTYAITKDYVYISTPERVAEFEKPAE